MQAMRMLISIDSLWDTRLGTVASLDVGYSSKLLLNGWHDRVTDDFKTKSKVFTAEQYDARYKRRDLDIISNSMRTMIPDYIYSLIEDEIRVNNVPREMQKFELHINTYPYLLDDEDCREIAGAVHELVPLATLVTCVRYATKDITPQVIKINNYIVHFLYELDEWMNTHITSLTEVRIPHCTLVAPELMVDPDWMKKLSPQELKELEGWTPNAMVEFISTEFYPIRRIPVRYFSSVL